MQLVFLDTETNGLNPNQSQILEVGAIICHLNQQTLNIDLVAKFESLSTLRQPLEDKITRITGITKQELAGAPTLFKAQESWLSFFETHLDLNQPVWIIGHSLDFDLGFLKAESWYLPEGAKFVDTLEISKILYPHKQAVNLEFLVEKLPLEETLTTFLDSSHTHHRSLYDSGSAFRLFKNILEQLKNQELDYRVLNYILQDILKMDQLAPVLSNTKSLDIPTHKIDLSEVDIRTDLRAQEVPINFNSKLKLLKESGHLAKVLDLWSSDLPQDILRIISQFSVIAQLGYKQPEWKLKFHASGAFSNDYQVAEVLIDYLFQTSDKTNPSDIKQFPILESLIWNVREVVSEVYRLGEAVEILEIFKELVKENESLLESIDRFISVYDFFIASMNPIWQNYVYEYFPKSLPIKEGFVKDKLINLDRELQSLKKELSGLNFLKGSVSQIFYQKVLVVINELFIPVESRAKILLVKNKIQVEVDRSGLDFIESINIAIRGRNDLRFQSYLDQDGLSLMVDKLGLEVDIEQVSTSPKIEFDTLHEVDLKDFYTEQIQTAKAKAKVCLILAGQNSSIKDSQKALVEDFQPSDYLLLGESGSLTKILSKIIKGFSGVAVVKFGAYNLFLQDKVLGCLDSIFILNQPYLFLHDYYLKKSRATSDPKAYLADFKKLFLDSQISRIKTKSDLDPTLIKSYHI